MGDDCFWIKGKLESSDKYEDSNHKKIGGREGLSCENYKKRNINGEQDKDDCKVKEIFNDTEKVKINGNHLDEVKTPKYSEGDKRADDKDKSGTSPTDSVTE